MMTKIKELLAKKKARQQAPQPIVEQQTEQFDWLDKAEACWFGNANLRRRYQKKEEFIADAEAGYLQYLQSGTSSDFDADYLENIIDFASGDKPCHIEAPKPKEIFTDDELRTFAGEEFSFIQSYREKYSSKEQFTDRVLEIYQNYLKSPSEIEWEKFLELSLKRS